MPKVMESWKNIWQERDLLYMAALAVAGKSRNMLLFTRFQKATETCRMAG
jgi:hypothetical protein